MSKMKAIRRRRRALSRFGIRPLASHCDAIYQAMFHAIRRARRHKSPGVRENGISKRDIARIFGFSEVAMRPEATEKP